MIFGFEIIFTTAAVIIIIAGVVYLLHDKEGKNNS